VKTLTRLQPSRVSFGTSKSSVESKYETAQVPERKTATFLVDMEKLEEVLAIQEAAQAPS